MASLLQVLQECLGIPLSHNCTDREQLLQEKQARIFTNGPTAEEIADKLVYTILSAEKNGEHLKRELDNIIGEYGWKEKVAEWTLAKLEKALHEASKLGPAVKEAYEKTCEVAKSVEGFVQEHPVFCTVIALGVLVYLAPAVLVALGFGELGPMEGMQTCTEFDDKMRF
jgi:ElaB/YqjD/DUF883 family membrane-anchored ribosome-binding protein